MQAVHFVTHDDARERAEHLFAAESAILAKLLPGTEIVHIGGTAVPRLRTKGDVDICVRIRPDEFEIVVKLLCKQYEVNQLHNWTNTYASFKDDSRDLGIQLCVRESVDDYFVAQRDYLRANPDAVAQLNELKMKYEGRDMEEYRAAKNAFFVSLHI